MAIIEKIQELRRQLIRQHGTSVPDEFQGVSKKRIATVIQRIDRHSPDIIDVIFALLDDRPSWFSNASESMRFCDGASTAHLGCHIGILQRGKGKLDREGRDVWIKPLREVGAIETVTLTKGHFVAGHAVAKSSNSSYRLDPSFITLLQTPEKDLVNAISAWIDADASRQRLDRQAKAAAEARLAADTKHSGLIKSACDLYARYFLSEFTLICIDDGDGDRIGPEKKALMKQAGIPTHALGAMPDALFWKPGTSEFAVIEAVTSDGEVDQHKVTSVTALIHLGHPTPIIHFVTAYRTWREAAARQGKHKNLAHNSWLWIMEDGARRFHVESM